MMVKDCENCIHCVDKKYWTCEYDEPCINYSLYEPENPKNYNKIGLLLANKHYM